MNFRDFTERVKGGTKPPDDNGEEKAVGQEPEKLTITEHALTEMVKTLVTELKKPSGEEAEKQAAQKARDKRNRDAMLEEIRRNEETRKANQAACSHQKPNGRWCTAGQPFSDGKVRIICLACQSVWEVPMSAETQRAVERGNISLAEMAPPREAVAA